MIGQILVQKIIIPKITYYNKSFKNYVIVRNRSKGKITLKHLCINTSVSWLCKFQSQFAENIHCNSVLYTEYYCGFICSYIS